MDQSMDHRLNTITGILGTKAIERMDIMEVKTKQSVSWDIFTHRVGLLEAEHGLHGQG